MKIAVYSYQPPWAPRKGDKKRRGNNKPDKKPKRTSNTDFKEPPSYRHNMPGVEFYQTREWMAARYQVFKQHGALCACCGATRKTGAVLQVDHIKPRSLYPDLELDVTNLQILCRECNLGKGATEKDWR